MKVNSLKIGGLTWWRNNYGSVLQAYALQETLNSIDGIDYEIICQYGRKIVSASNLKQKLAEFGILETLKRAFWKFAFKKLRMRNVNIQKFMDENLKISGQEYVTGKLSDTNSIYDGFICGSDQIWNPDLVELDSIYWLNFADEGKLKIAYAPSVGVSSVTKEQSEMIRTNLKGFKAVSSREENGTRLINEALGEDKCVTVLDPTLLVEKNFWDEICPAAKYTEPYIFVYMLRGTKKQRRLIEKFAKRKGLKIVTMPFLDHARIELYDLFFGDIKFWDADPSDFISVIKNAEYVFTDSFHSMVFSCIYHKSFFTFPKIGKSQISRLVYLQEMFNIQNRMITEETTADDILNAKEIDWKQVDLILEQKREFSYNYLSNALK